MGPLMGQTQRGQPMRWGDGVSPAEEGRSLGDFKPAVAQPASLWLLQSRWLNGTGLGDQGQAVGSVDQLTGPGRGAESWGLPLFTEETCAAELRAGSGPVAGQISPPRPGAQKAILLGKRNFQM